MTAATPADPAPLPVEAEEFLVWLGAERGRSPNTVAAYRRDLRKWSAHVRSAGRDLTSATESDVISFVHDLRAKGGAPSSVARTLVAVRSVHRFLVDEGLAELDPAADVEPPRVPQGLPKAMSEADIERLLAAIVGDDPLARRDRAMLEVLYGTGIRISELVGLDLADVDLGSDVLRVLGKGDKQRVVPVGGCAHDAIEAWLAAPGRPAVVPERVARRRDAEAVFLNARGGRLSRQGAWGIVRKYGDRVGLGDRLTPHVLRHSCATHMLDHGADIRAVQELLGHASISTTQVYTLVSTERLWQVYAEAHPRAGGV